MPHGREVKVESVGEFVDAYPEFRDFPEEAQRAALNAYNEAIESGVENEQAVDTARAAAEDAAGPDGESGPSEAGAGPPPPPGGGGGDGRKLIRLVKRQARGEAAGGPS